MENLETFDIDRINHFIPKEYNDVKNMAVTLKKFKTISINFSDLSSKDKIRVLDFMMGVMYALNGTYNKITKNIYVIEL
ncbi:cell division inhibitor SepF [Spiroplasma sp. TIUS-1]|uniref:cell division protein SepF n=1 Tax=Spiroplasma sp. TIUS-1 TaxID=216963 RepID=UPI001397DFFA|nr:cell division protein SepF [Spiroplasma sp. TIUS-1]QHX35996.1 cell division inhibitor SepF [Spiroplasma sp. TIUS-1]